MQHSKHFNQILRYGLCFACIAILMLCFSSFVESSSTNPRVTQSQEKAPEVSLALMSATKTFNQEHSTAMLGVQFILHDNWKIFWRSPGPGGIPPSFDWSASKNISEAKTLWPYPKYQTLFNQHSVVYENEVIFPVHIKITNPKEKAVAALKMDYALCRKDGCIPKTQTLKLNLYPGAGEASRDQKEIQEFLQRVPKLNHHDLLSIHAAELNANDNNNSELLITVSSKTPFNNPELFIETKEQVFFDKPTIYTKINDTKFQFAIKFFHTDSQHYSPNLLQKNVKLTLVDQAQSLEKHLLITPVKASLYDILIILFIAFLGGVILNFMPCVLPVLFIKIVDILEDSAATKKRIRFDFLSTVLGIMVSFLILAMTPILIKYLGNNFAWGGQFQQPVFLVFMAVILTVFSCNFFGLFEINLFSTTQNKVSNLQFKNNFLEHFFRGVFATLLATPCAAPFLGTALGFALSRSPLEIILVLSIMGFGFSLPYLLIALFPGFEKLIPKPGKWMIQLKVILGVALIMTVFWLLYVLAGQISLYATCIVIIGLLLMVGILLAKHFTQFISTIIFRIAIGLLFVCLLIVPYLPFSHSQPQKEVMATATTDKLWQPFSLEAIQNHLTAGKIVFVDVTAKWCLTCHFNKQFVLDRKPIVALLSRSDIVAMRADWTRRSAKIADYLKSFNRYAIPFNVVYSKKYPKGIVLPELLSQDAVLEAIKKAQ